jgi:hypothetical protein
MRLAKKVFLIILILFIVAYASGYIFLATQGRRIIIEKLKNVTQRQVEIGAVRMYSPWQLKIDDVRIGGIGKAASVEMSPSILGFLAGRTVLYSITVIKPEVAFTKPMPQPQETTIRLQDQAVQVPSAKKAEFIFYRLHVKDGTFVFSDQSVGSDTGGIIITLKDLSADITNTYQFPKEIMTKFALTANIPWKDSKDQGSVSLDGWMNYSKKDMRADLVMKDIDALYLYPYYAGWFNLDKASIEKAKLGFTSNVTGLNNDVTAACHLELTEIVFKQREESTDQTRSERIAHKVLDFFKSMNNGKVVLNFSIKTKMDSPDFGVNAIKSAFDNTITQARKGQGSTASKVMEMPGQVVGGTVKGVTDVSSALIGGVVSVGKEIGKSLGASFRRESAEPRSPPQTASPPEPAKEINATVEQKPADAPVVNETTNNAAETNPAQVNQAQDAVNSTVTNTTEATPVQVQ